jgi:hypothetical protein
MRRLRFSIASIMAFTVYAAIGLAALAQVDDPWYARVLDDTYFMVTVFTLAIATILAVIRRGHFQAILVGFATFGWTHLNFGWPDSEGPSRRANVITTAKVGPTYRPRFPHTTIIGLNLADYLPANPGTNPLRFDYTWHIIQSTMTMATAVVGAFVGSYLWKRGERLGSRSGCPAPNRIGIERSQD